MNDEIDLVRRARLEERTLARLDGHDRLIAELRASVREIKEDVSSLERVIGEQTAATHAVAGATRDATSRAISRRTFVVGVASILATSIVSLIVGIVGGHL